jgi:hypothetical protein
MSQPGDSGGHEEEMEKLKMPLQLNRQMAKMMDTVFEVMESINDHLSDVLMGFCHDGPVYGKDKDEEVTATVNMRGR